MSRYDFIGDFLTSIRNASKAHKEKLTAPASVITVRIAELLKNNTVYSLTVVIMEVPCCSGLVRIVQEAVELSGTRLPVKKIVIGLDGTLRS